MTVMAAAILDGVGEAFTVEEVHLDPPGPGELLVQIKASGLCASDLNAIDGKRTLVPFPAVLGHEAAGIVTEVGPGVVDFAPGDHVVLAIVPSCGQCSMCQGGHPNYCLTAGDAMSVGGLMDGTSRLRRTDGRPLHHFLTVASFAEYAVVPASGAVRIPPEMPLDRAALISCAVLTGYGAVMNTARVPAGARVAVFGCGGVGLNVIQGARLAGASRIVAVDVTEDKLALATKVGATDTVNATEQDPVAVISDLGRVDYAFEALGREATIQQAWRSLDAFGEAVLVGLLRHGATLTIDAGPFVNEQSIKGCYFGSSDIHRDVPMLVRAYLDGDLMLDEIISRRIGLADLNDAFQDLRDGEGARNVLVFD